MRHRVGEEEVCDESGDGGNRVPAAGDEICPRYVMLEVVEDSEDGEVADVGTYPSLLRAATALIYNSST
jgi:hypothetical protein